VLLRDLREKQQVAQTMTTQMSFNPGALASWIERIRGEGITLPIHLGIPGDGITQADGCGRADWSLRFSALSDEAPVAARTFLRPGSFGADAFLRDLAPVLAKPGADARALHMFTMNQVEQTVAWQRQMLNELRTSPK
jgi:methylenetetrahydrofolate reductase (NADPH)